MKEQSKSYDQSSLAEQIESSKNALESAMRVAASWIPNYGNSRYSIGNIAAHIKFARKCADKLEERGVNVSQYRSQLDKLAEQARAKGVSI